LEILLLIEGGNALSERGEPWLFNFRHFGRSFENDGWL
jgi:hypothetical protein